VCRGGPEVPLIVSGTGPQYAMSHQVIARKFRPQTFAELVGQQHVVRTLENAIRTGRVAHAYIFSGARGVGKTTTARILAKALNCVKGPTTEPCNQCPSCLEITAGNSLDVLEIDAASNRGIDQVRELREMVRYAPAGSRHKVVILDEAHMLTTEASNALLKTLEEPPDRVIFVMATTEPEKLVDTIRSRAQHFHFRALSFGEIVHALESIVKQEKVSAEPGALAVMARAADGSLRDGLSLLEQALAYCGDRITEAQVREILGVVGSGIMDELTAAVQDRSATRVLALVHQLLAEGQNLQQFCREAVGHFRNLLVARVCGADSDLIAAAPEEHQRLAQAAAQFSEEDLTRFFQILLQTEDDVRRKPDPRLHLEMGLLRLVQAGRLAPLEEVIAELSGAEPRPRRATSGPAAKALPSAPDAPRAEMQAAAAPAAPSRPSSPASKAASEATPKAPVTAAPDVPATPTLDVGPLPGPGALSTQTSDGLDAAQVTAIKSAIASQQRFLAELVEHASRWQMDKGEISLYFPTERRALAEMLQSRESLEKLRTITSAILGKPLRVCVKLEAAPVLLSTVRAGQNSRELRARFEQDPIVRAMLERFGGKIAEVKGRSEE
jgi:DNA polymerase-3 subunit gamma/tau